MDLEEVQEDIDFAFTSLEKVGLDGFPGRDRKRTDRSMVKIQGSVFKKRKQRAVMVDVVAWHDRLAKKDTKNTKGKKTF